MEQHTCYHYYALYAEDCSLFSTFKLQMYLKHVHAINVNTHVTNLHLPPKAKHFHTAFAGD